MAYGLTDSQLNQIRDVFDRSGLVKKVTLFGSRAKDNFKPGSDIDLALSGNDLNLNTLLTLYESLENLDLPYTFDLVIFDRIDDPALKEHINRVGISLFEQEINVK